MERVGAVIITDELGSGRDVRRLDSLALFEVCVYVDLSLSLSLNSNPARESSVNTSLCVQRVW